MRIVIKLILIIFNFVCLPVTCSVLLGFLIYKQVVCLLAKRFQKFVEPIAGQSNVFVSDKYESNPHSVIVTATALDRICSKNDMIKWLQFGYDQRDKLGQRCYRALAYSPVRYLGYGFWKEVLFGCRKYFIMLLLHLYVADRVHYLSESMGVAEGEEFIPNVAEILQRLPFNENQPLWDFYLHNYRKENRTMLYLRFHHLLSDGMSIIKFIYAMSGFNQLPATFIQPRSAFSLWNYIRKNIVGALWTGIQLLPIGTVEYLIEFFLTKDRHALHFSLNGELKLTGVWRCTMGKRLDLQEVKEASKRLRCSISHIFFAGINSGLEKYFATHHANQESSTFRGVTMLPLPNHPNKRLVNYWTLGKFYFPKLSLDIHEKLEYFKSEAKRAYSSILTVYASHIFHNIVPVIPWRVLDVLYKVKAHSTITFSNVVGPQNEDVLVAQSKITDMWFFPPIPLEAMALAAGIISSNGGIRICFTGDIGSIEKREELESLADMIDSAIRDIITLDT